MKKLIYIMDPHCGWCYGNSSNITSIQNKFSQYFEFEIIAGGMWLVPNAPIGGPALSQFLLSNSETLIERTGISIGKSFYSLASNSDYTFSSLEPCAAITLVKERDPANVFRFAKELQSSIFLQGNRLDKFATYLPLLELINFNPESFEKHWMFDDNLSKTTKEFQKASTLCNGFPSFLLNDNESLHTLSSGYFDKITMANYLETLI